ncbi:hypothetical protein PTTG_28298 [Puccinia triticina 1-1 BBBD Race 1]|uniref:DUF4219 domain-containing protein n=1 Tax=Puccinia triticina (isolate 1-1 / race 1 (BBBD)) TaxID=630390 RepID=A0A180GD82_PUCT1|nr:hypothetical protein PTTG_28298 [Puccinia triticina 1-1 BBBD Race 1]
MEAFNRKDAMDDKGLNNIPVLKGDNYTLWRNKLKFFLNARQLWDVCVQFQPPPLTEITKIKHACALSHLSVTIDNSIFNATFANDEDITPYQVWTLLKNKYAAQSIFSLCRVWEDWDAIYYDTTLMQYIDKVHECLTEFKTLGIDTSHVLFSCCIISRVSRVKRSIVENILNDATVASDPFLLLVKLRDHAIFEVTELKRKTLKRSIEGTSSDALLTNVAKSSKKVKKNFRKRITCSGGKHNPEAYHDEKDCWTVHDDKLPDRFKEKPSDGTSLTSSTALVPSTSNARIDDDARSAPSFHYCSVAVNLNSISMKLPAVLDSGASHHMFN